MGLGLSTKVLPQAMATGNIHIGHHDREVERRDAGHHAQRLAHGPVVYAGGNLFGVVALEQLRNAGGEFHNFDAAGDFALRVGEHLAVLGGDHAGQVVAVLVEQFQELEHDARTAQRRGVGPGREGSLRGGHSGIHFVGAGQGHLASHGAGGGVEHVLGARGAREHLAAYVVANVLRGDGSG
jgi:hypothetical protein